MRKIKFRAWSNGEMQYSEGATDFGFWKWVGYDSTTELMQFTGLTDKNGVEIYEGDIVEDKSINAMRDTPDKDVYEIYYWQGCASIKNVLDPSDNEYLWDYHRVCEVIGNIYQSPELLTRKQNL